MLHSERTACKETIFENSGISLRSDGRNMVGKKKKKRKIIQVGKIQGYTSGAR